MPGTEPAGDGIWTGVYGAIRITIESRPIPEPSTVRVIAAAIPVLLSMKLRPSF
jgi:hypothetical protein